MDTPGIPVEQVMPARPEKALAEELTITKHIDGTYSFGWHRPIDAASGEGAGEQFISRERALKLAEELLG